jgi:parvulin-like peptidyl-prolyl isomerase
LQNPENDWSSAEAYIRSILPQQKLYKEIAAGAVVSDEAVREEYIRQTAKAKAEYIGVLFTDVAAGYEPSADEIDAWYAAHPDDYRSDVQAQATVVRFKKTPSDADAKEVLDFSGEIRADIVAGRKDFAAAAAEYSEDTGSAQRGGDLGKFDRNRMVAPFTEAAFSLPVGEVSQPVRTDFGYHLIEVLDQVVDKSGQVTEITARHILLKVAPGPETLDLIRESATEFASRVNAGNFVSTAEAEALDLVAPGPFTAARDIPSIPLSLQGSDFVFAAKPGEVSPVFENRDFFYVVLAGAPIPAGVRLLDEVRSQVTLAVRQEHDLTAAKAKLAPAVGEVQMGRSMAEVAQSAGLAHAVTDTFTANGNIDGVGYGTEFNMSVINGKVGELLPEIVTLRGVFATRPLWISPFNAEDYSQRQPGLQAVLLQRAQNEVINTWFDEQLAAADIVDHRHRLR